MSDFLAAGVAKKKIKFITHSTISELDLHLIMCGMNVTGEVGRFGGFIFSCCNQMNIRNPSLLPSQ